jgi:hypothetical protein
MGAKASAGFQTEIDFELPKGYVDDTGTLHRRGQMRLATAADEILPLRDPRVQQNEAYLAIIVLARVITRLGSLPEIHTGVIEGLYASDLSYLQRLYETFNGGDDVEQAPRAAPRANGGNSLRGMTTLGEA